MINYKQILPQLSTLSGKAGLVVIDIKSKEILLSQSEDSGLWQIPQISDNANVMPLASDVSNTIGISANDLTSIEVDSYLQRKSDFYFCYSFSGIADSVCDKNCKWVGVYDSELTSSEGYTYVLELYYCFILQLYANDSNVDEDFNRKRTYNIASMLLTLYMHHGIDENYIYSAYSAIKQMNDCNEYIESNYWDFKLAIAEYIKDTNNSERVLIDTLSEALTYIHQIPREKVILKLCGMLLALYKGLGRTDNIYRLIVELMSFFDALGSYIKLRIDVLNLFSEYIDNTYNITSYYKTICSDRIILLTPYGNDYAQFYEIYTQFAAESDDFSIVSQYYRFTIIQILKQYRKFRSYEIKELYFKDKELYCLDKLIPLCDKLSMLYVKNNLWQRHQRTTNLRYFIVDFIAKEQKEFLKISDAEHNITAARWFADEKDYNSAYSCFKEAVEIYKDIHSFRCACNALQEIIDYDIVVDKESVKQEISELENKIEK